MVIIILVVIFILLYLWLIMPRVINKPDMTPFRGHLYAHRGLHDNKTDAPENSLKAFAKAVEAGYGIELDIQLTKDGEAVVFHDGTLKRICGVEGYVSDYTFEELQQFTLCESDERIPKFTEVLKLVDGKVPLIVEFKGEKLNTDLCPVADKILKDYKGVYCMESFNPLMVAWYRKNRNEVVRGQLSHKFFTQDKRSARNFLLQNLLLNFYAKPDFIAYEWSDHSALSRVLCAKLYKITSVAWTIKSEEDLRIAGDYFDLFIFDSFVPTKMEEKATVKD